MMAYPGINFVDNVPTDQQARTQDLHSRNGDVLFIIHHSVTLTIDATIATFKSDREVSANFAMGPHVAGSDDILVALCVPEERRAWTSASSWDDKALTVEVCDKALGGNYPVSQNAKEELAKIAAYMHVEYAMPLDRNHVISHQEVYARGGGSYATACPGPDLQGSMDWIVNRAAELVSGVNTSTVRRGDNDLMSAIHRRGVPNSGIIIRGSDVPYPLEESVFVATANGLGLSIIELEQWQYDTVVREQWTAHASANAFANTSVDPKDAQKIVDGIRANFPAPAPK